MDGNTVVHGIAESKRAGSLIMPMIPGGELNAPAIVPVEQSADRIAGRDPLPRAHVPVWVYPKWQAKQRRRDGAESRTALAYSPRRG